jgi:DNA repair protein RadD
MHFDHLLARADESTLEALLGSATLRVLDALDRNLSQPSNLKRVVRELHGPEGLLGSARLRPLLLDLLRLEEARQLTMLLQLPTDGDVYRQLRDLKISRGSKREALLYQFFGLSAPVREAVVEVATVQIAEPRYGLFAHQRSVVREVSELLEDGSKRVLLHMPTGAGKTRAAMNLIVEHLRRRENALVVWLAYSEELCEQAAEEFERAWSALGNRAASVHRFWGGHDLQLEHAHDGILIAGLAKMYRLAKSATYSLGQLGSRSTLVIIDEAHQAIAETYQLVLESLLVHGRGADLLGLSATPGRTWSDMDADERLAQFFGKNKVTLRIKDYDNPIDYLVEAGYLADAHFRRLLIESGVALSDSDLDRLREGLDVPDSVLCRLAEDEQRTLAVVHRIESLLLEHRRILVFATTVEHSDVIASILQARGHHARSVTGSTPAAERARSIEAFRSDDERPMVLCNYGVLTTGFDAPATSAVLIARPTKSLVLYSQMVGRGIRGPRAGGNSEAEIVTVVDRNLPGFGSVASAFTNWEDVWE